MPIRIVEDACKTQGGLCLIVIEGDTLDEVTSLDAKRQAIKAAQGLGVDAHGISGTTGGYMVNSGGRDLLQQIMVTPEQIHKVAMLQPKNGHGKFRNEYTIVSSQLVP